MAFVQARGGRSEDGGARCSSVLPWAEKEAMMGADRGRRRLPEQASPHAVAVMCITKIIAASVVEAKMFTSRRSFIAFI